MSTFLNHIKTAASFVKKKSVEYELERHAKTAGKVALNHAATVAEKTQKLGSETLDTITRKSTDEEVREHILLQSRYNDILAVQLDDALKRIRALEERVYK